MNNERYKIGSINKITEIHKKLIQLSQTLDKIKSLTSETLLINDKDLYYDVINNINDRFKMIDYEIRNSVIPTINDK